MKYIAFIVIIINMWTTASSLRNIAKNGTAKQSSVYVWNEKNMTADLAISGGPTNDYFSKSCATTGANKSEAWWMLTFPVDTIFVSSITIYYRNNTLERFALFSLYISNVSMSIISKFPSDKDLCYQHKGPGFPSMIESRDCNALGRNVIIYNKRTTNTSNEYGKHAWLELCDVQVYGCYKGWSGNDCTSPCPSVCKDKHCFPNNGTCVWGCLPDNCLRDKCYYATGICVEGCKPGVAGHFCDKYNLASNKHTVVKPDNHNSTLSVDGDKTDKSCIRTSGVISWLQVDLVGLNVITSIYLSYENNDTVGLRSEDHTIYVTNTSGSWINGLRLSLNASNGFPYIMYNFSPVIGQYVLYVPAAIDGIAYTDICEIEVIGCPTGKYGVTCNKTCPQNCGGSCHLETGQCMFGCKDGWLGVDCGEQCKSPNFGHNCKQVCNCLNDASCFHVNGTCPPGGCQKGWEGDSCSKACKNGSYGYSCNETCLGCVSYQCDTIDGHCNTTGRCNPGWFGTKCNEQCHDGYFGDCESRCYCLEGVCNKATGSCPGSKCQNGWMGESCSTECNNGTYGFNCANSCYNCRNQSCERFEGNCTFGCSDGFHGYQCQLLDAVHQTDNPSNMAGSIVGGILAAIVTVVLIAVTIVLLRRRYDGKNLCAQKKLAASGTKDDVDNINADDYLAPTTKKIENDYANVAAIANEEDVNLCFPSVLRTKKNTSTIATEYVYSKHIKTEDENNIDHVYSSNESEPSSAQYRIAVTDLQSVISGEQLNERVTKEYEILPRGLVRPHVSGSKEENKAKNRFLNTWPYDHSRVVLQGNSSNDYINASYIDNYSKIKAYIATQGPKVNTIKDFWQMIWQENAEVIIMVTKLEEEERKKCEQYWPEFSTQSLHLGVFDVSLIQESEYTVYVYRKIQIFNKVSKQDRTVHHFHFTKWPDHDVPDKIELVSFYRKVKLADTSLNGPMVVHCSAGLGRTGTFIAVDALYENGMKTGYVDIMEYVQIMRKDRMNMIQTEKQYKTVYEALSELFTIPDTAIGVGSYREHLENLKKDSLRHEFQKMAAIKPVYTSKCFRAAKSEENTCKNVVQNILPHDNYRPFLMSFERSRNDYINAVIIPDCQGKTKYLVTQYPLKDTVVDFWTLLYDNDCTAVVLLEAVKNNIPLWPYENTFDFKMFSVKQILDDLPFSVEIALQNKKKNDCRIIKIIIMDDWNEDNIPHSSKCMLELLEKVCHWRKTNPGPIAVTCKDGCQRSGLFVALDLTFEKLKMDNEVDIFQAIRRIQIRRPEFLSNFDQYEYCYKCVKDKLEENESLYANT